MGGNFAGLFSGTMAPWDALPYIDGPVTFTVPAPVPFGQFIEADSNRVMLIMHSDAGAANQVFPMPLFNNGIPPIWLATATDAPLVFTWFDDGPLCTSAWGCLGGGISDLIVCTYSLSSRFEGLRPAAMPPRPIHIPKCPEVSKHGI